MNKDMLVEIFADFGHPDGIGKVSTGYPVAKDRILTARHGLYDENGSLTKSVEVRWYYQRDKEGCNWQTAEIVDCDMDEILDVILLKCQFPTCINYNVRFAFNNPDSDFEWESEGFAAAGQRDIKRPPTPLAGEVYHAADGADWLQLIEKGKAEVPKLWRGISGAPVFKKNSNELVGVIVECPDNFDAIRLYATPLWKLADNRQFRSEIAKVRELDLQQIRDDLKTILSDSPSLVQALAKELRGDPESEEALAETLINISAGELLKYCEGAVSNLAQARDRTGISKGKALVNYLLPIVFEPHTIETICAQSQIGVCRVDVGSETVAEIVMAGKDGRAAKYWPAEKNKAPTGVYLLDSPAYNQGIGSETWVKNFKSQITKDFARLDQLAVGQEQGLSEPQKLVLAVDELEGRVNDGRTYYYVYRPPKDALENAELSKVIEKLHQELSGHVVFIECGGFDLIRKERRSINRPLAKILQTEVEENP